MIDINFGSLFTIDLLHKYYTDQLCPDFNISVSAKTTALINGYKILVKQYNNKLYAGVQSVAAGTSLKPFTPVEEGMQLTFFLWLNNPVFSNYTNLGTSVASGKIYYFSNRNNNVANGKNFLSAKILPYNAAQTYQPGDLAADGAGLVYHAIKTNKPGAAFDLTNNAYWVPVTETAGNNQYQSEADACQWLPSLSAYNFDTPQATAAVTILGYNTATKDYTKPFISQSLTFKSPLSSFTLDLTILDPGKYLLTVNGKKQWIYINDELSAGKAFAVIDIFNDSGIASCQLVDVNKVLTSPKYSLFFLNRATIWKYVLASGNAANVSDTVTAYKFANSVNGLTSVTPIPLSDKALTLKLTLTANNVEHTPIASADPQRLAAVTKDGDTYSCSEIYLNF